MGAVLSLLGRAIGAVPTFVWVIGVLVAAYLYQLYTNQNNILYYPQPPGLPWKRTSDNPPNFGSPGFYDMKFDNVRITAADGVSLHGWFVKAPASVDYTTAPTIMFCHANAGNMGFRLPNVELLVKKLHFNVFIFDYRGYGDSDDVPITEEGIKLDGFAAAAYLASRTDIDHRKVFYFGRSLGGAVAVNTAFHRPHESAGLILENTFTSISEMVDEIFPILKHVKGLLLKIHWRSVDLVPALEHPMLFISGGQDRLVPPAMLRRLHDAAVRSTSRELYVVEDADHNDTFVKGGDEYIRRVREFVVRTLRAKLGTAAATRMATPSAGAAAGGASSSGMAQQPLSAAASAAAAGATAAAASTGGGVDGRTVPAASAMADTSQWDALAENERDDRADVVAAGDAGSSAGAAAAAAAGVSDNNAGGAAGDPAPLVDEDDTSGLRERIAIESASGAEAAASAPIGVAPTLGAAFR